MSTLRVFKSTFATINFVMPNGKQLIFRNGTFYTDQESEIALLEYEIKQGHPHIFIDPENQTVEAEDLLPGVALKKGVIAQMSAEELRAALAAKEAEATNPENDMGKSDQTQVKPAGTTTIAAAAAGGSGVSLAARLATLQVAKSQ